MNKSVNSPASAFSITLCIFCICRCHSGSNKYQKTNQLSIYSIVLTMYSWVLLGLAFLLGTLFNETKIRIRGNQNQVIKENVFWRNFKSFSLHFGNCANPPLCWSQFLDPCFPEGQGRWGGRRRPSTQRTSPGRTSRSSWRCPGSSSPLDGEGHEGPTGQSSGVLHRCNACWKKMNKLQWKLTTGRQNTTPDAVRQYFVHVCHLFLQPFDHGNHLIKSVRMCDFEKMISCTHLDKGKFLRRWVIIPSCSFILLNLRILRKDQSDPH